MSDRPGNHVVVRPMREDDVSAMAALRCAAFFAGTDRSPEIDAAGLSALIETSGYEVALVAEVDGRAVGTVLFIRNELEPAHDVTPWLAGLVVDPAYRGLGIGRLLVRAIENHAWTQGCARLHLYTGAAESFYAGLGWSVAERFDEQGEPMVLMTRSPQ